MNCANCVLWKFWELLFGWIQRCIYYLVSDSLLNLILRIQNCEPFVTTLKTKLCKFSRELEHLKCLWCITVD